MNNFTTSGRMGPRIFLSYSFADSAAAQALADFLVARGHQVHLEDDTSLMDQQLGAAIRKAIAGAEILIQLLTPNSVQSSWVAREMEMAIDIRATGQDLAILPVLTSGVGKPAAIQDFWYLRAQAERLTSEEMEEVHRFALRSVFALPLDPENPFKLGETALSALLDVIGDSDRRVILDPEQQIMGWAQDTLDYATSLGDVGKGILAQETRYAEALPLRLAKAEAVLGVLAKHTVRLVAEYASPVKRRALELQIIEAFCKVVLGEFALHAASVAPAAPHPLRTTLAVPIEAAQARWTHGGTQRSTYLEEPYYKSIFAHHLTDGTFTLGEAEMVLMEMIGGKSKVRLIVPDIMFGSMADVYTRSSINFDPRGEILDGHFLKIIFWQIAVYAFYNFPEAAYKDRDVLDQVFDWKLSDYSQMGLA